MSDKRLDGELSDADAIAQNELIDDTLNDAQNELMTMIEAYENLLHEIMDSVGGLLSAVHHEWRTKGESERRRPLADELEISLGRTEEYLQGYLSDSDPHSPAACLESELGKAIKLADELNSYSYGSQRSQIAMQAVSELLAAAAATEPAVEAMLAVKKANKALRSLSTTSAE